MTVNFFTPHMKDRAGIDLMGILCFFLTHRWEFLLGVSPLKMGILTFFSLRDGNFDFFSPQGGNLDFFHTI